MASHLLAESLSRDPYKSLVWLLGTKFSRRTHKPDLAVISAEFDGDEDRFADCSHLKPRHPKTEIVVLIDGNAWIGAGCIPLRAKGVQRRAAREFVPASSGCHGERAGRKKRSFCWRRCGTVLHATA
jgi:hypothetical protein